MKKFKKKLLVIPIVVIFLCVTVSAEAPTVKGLSFTGSGYFTNTTNGSKYIPNSSNSNAVYPDNSVFNNAVSLWFSYDNTILNSGQYGYQDLWIDPFEIGSYTMTFAVDYSSYFISDIVIHSDNQKFTNGYYQTVGTKTVNGKTYYMVKFSFNVLSVESNNGLTGGYIRIGLGARKSNITTFGAFIIDITANTSTGQILENQQQNTQSIIDNQNQNAQNIIEYNYDNTQDIIDNQKDNTQSIIDNQNELAEQEKNDINSSGNSAVESVEDSIPNYNFMDSLKMFIDCIKSTDTTCIIDIPEIYIPSVAGIPRTVLYDGGQFDFATAIDVIPARALKLVQNLNTIALILFCGKEMYEILFGFADGASKIGTDVSNYKE